MRVVLAGIFVTLIIFAVCSTALLGIHRLVFDTEPEETILIGYLLTALAVGAVLTVWITMKDREKMHWVLTEDELVGGIKRVVRIPISSIVTIAQGVPARTKLMEGNPWLQSGIVVKTADSRLLALNLATDEEGAKLMTTLLERCWTVLTPNPTYTASELAILHRRSWNTVFDIPSGRPV